MGHDAGHEEENKPVVVTKAAVAFGLLIIGGLIATTNFIQVMGHSDEGHGTEHGTQVSSPAHDEKKSAPPAHKVDEPMTNTPKKASSSTIEDPKTTDDTEVGH